MWVKASFTSVTSVCNIFQGVVKANTQHTRVCYDKFNCQTLRPLLMATLSLRGSNIYKRLWQHWQHRARLFYVGVTYTILVNQILLYGVQVSRCVIAKSRLLVHSRPVRAGPFRLRMIAPESDSPAPPLTYG